MLTASTFAQSTQPAVPQRASCVIRLATDRDRFGEQSTSAQAAQAVMAALTSTALIDPAMQATLSLSPNDWPKVAQVDVQPAGDIAVKLNVLIRPSGNLPAGSADKLMHEIAQRLLRSFNSDEAKPADKSPEIATLQKEHDENDSKMAKLRDELNAAQMRSNTSAFPGSPMGSRPMLEQQIVDLNTDVATQKATIDAIEEQLKSLGGDDYKETRVKLVGQRVDANIAIAKANARAAQLQQRIADMNKPTTGPATRQPYEIQQEISTLMNRQNVIERRLSTLRDTRENLPGKPRLVVLDGSAS